MRMLTILALTAGLLAGNRAAAAELKVGRRKPSPEQMVWLDELCRVPGVESHVWTPDDWPTIEQVLR